MAVIETKYSVGEKVWLASTTTETKQHPCPDCKDTRQWNATSPAGDKFTFACPRCSASYSSFDDMSLKYQAHVPLVREMTIGSIRYDSHEWPHRAEPPTSYMCCETGVGSGSIYREDRLFMTESDALKHAEVLANIADKTSEWIGKRYNKTLQISDYQLSSAALKIAQDEQSKARSFFYNISDLFESIKDADDKDAILEAVEEYRRWHLERDVASVDRSPKGEDREDGLHAQHESAVAKPDAQNTPRYPHE
jgi:hypothetical protein